jgi:hypothetical protein
MQTSRIDPTGGLPMQIALTGLDPAYLAAKDPEKLWEAKEGARALHDSSYFSTIAFAPFRPGVNLPRFVGVFIGETAFYSLFGELRGGHEGDILSGDSSRCSSRHDGTVQNRVTSLVIRWSWVRVPPAYAVAQWQSGERIPAR